MSSRQVSPPGLDRMMESWDELLLVTGLYPREFTNEVRGTGAGEAADLYLILIMGLRLLPTSDRECLLVLNLYIVVFYLYMSIAS